MIAAIPGAAVGTKPDTSIPELSRIPPSRVYLNAPIDTITQKFRLCERTSTNPVG